MPDEKIGMNTPLELTPEGFVRPISRGILSPGSAVFTVQEVLIAHRVVARRGDWKSCAILMTGMMIEETRIVGQEGTVEFNKESRDCGLLTDWLAEHDLFLDENKTATKA